MKSNARIAIIGSGVAGLSAAWYLAKFGHHVTVFEQAAKPGLAKNSHDFAELLGVESPAHGDIPSRMFNAALWPTVVELYRDAGVEVEPVESSQVFLEQDKVFFHARLPYSKSSLLFSMLKAQPRRVFEQLNFLKQTGQAFLAGGSEEACFGDFIGQQAQSELDSRFLKHFLYPALSATVFTCSIAELLDYPAVIVLDALNRIVGQGNESSLLRTRLGSADAAKKLLAHVNSIHMSTTVERIEQRDDQVAVWSAGDEEMFDHAIIATQANHVERLVADHPDEIAVLNQFVYTDVPVAVHFDASVMPKSKEQWSTFNFTSNHSQPMCTVWMNQFHPTWPAGVRDVFQSIFPNDIDRSSVIAESVLQRPVVNASTKGLIQQLAAIHQKASRRIWYAGSYAGEGVPLLESACRSSKQVVGQIVRALDAVQPQG